MNALVNSPADCSNTDDTCLDAAIVRDLSGDLTYQQIADRHGVSRGKVWSIAVEHKARKNENRIQERVAERKRRQREFLLEATNTTLKADVLDYMDGLPDGAVQLHVTSLRYNVGKNYGDAPILDRRSYHFYLGWALQLLAEMERTLAPGGVMFLQLGSTKDDFGRLRPLDIMLFPYLEGMGLTFQNRVIWEVPHGLTPKRRLSERNETALVFSKQEPRVFNPTPAREPQKFPNKRAFKGPNKGRLSGHPLGAWPSNVWHISNVGNDSPEKTGHPAQFPEELVRRAVMLYSMPGDLVVDALVGSGTSCAVAKRTGRAFSGCDLFYEDQRRSRLAAVAPDLVSPLPGVSSRSIAVWQAEARVRSFPAGDGEMLAA